MTASVPLRSRSTPVHFGTAAEQVDGVRGQSSATIAAHSNAATIIAPLCRSLISADSPHAASTDSDSATITVIRTGQQLRRIGGISHSSTAYGILPLIRR